MALINCPDCRKEISDRAPTCPNCGAPMHSTPAVNNGQYVTTQSTAKTYKQMMLIGGILCGIGAGVVFGVEDPYAPGFGVLAMTLGIALYALGRFKAWWNNG